MKFAFTVHGPITANSYMGACKMANGLVEEIEKRTGQRFTVTLHGPIDNERASAQAGRDEDHGDEGGPGTRAGQAHPGDDFADEAGHGEGRTREDRDEDGADGLQRPGDGDDAPKRGRGRPRKQRDGDDGAGASGGAPARQAAEGPERRSGDGERPRGSAESGERDGARGTDAGTRESRGDRHQGSDDARRSDAPVPGNRGGDQAQAGVTDASDADGMDFNDPEPETALTMADVNGALTRLFSAMGKGATRKHIADALTDIAGVSQPRDIPEEGYAKVIREVDAQIELYKSGKRKI